MTTQLNIIETNENGVKWVEVSGTDYGTNWEFEGAEVFGITEDDRILDCDGCPLTEGDHLEIAVRNAIEASKK
jgi:hypothetical protein